MCQLEEYIFKQLLQLTCSIINMKIDKVSQRPTAMTTEYFFINNRCNW